MRTSLMIASALLVWIALSAVSEPTSAEAGLRSKALETADFILDAQRPSGAIPDSPGSRRVNEDSNMEYALIGLGAAYKASGDHRYLDGLRKGIIWLADREEMDDPRWRGSFHYVYSANPPFRPIPTSSGRGVRDVRGVDATSQSSQLTRVGALTLTPRTRLMGSGI